MTWLQHMGCRRDHIALRTADLLEQCNTENCCRFTQLAAGCKRLSGLDASFLYIEVALSPVHLDGA